MNGQEIIAICAFAAGMATSAFGTWYLISDKLKRDNNVGIQEGKVRNGGRNPHRKPDKKPDIKIYGQGVQDVNKR